jgi:hypothetical protein
MRYSSFNELLFHDLCNKDKLRSHPTIYIWLSPTGSCTQIKFISIYKFEPFSAVDSGLKDKSRTVGGGGAFSGTVGVKDRQTILGRYSILLLSATGCILHYVIVFWLHDLPNGWWKRELYMYMYSSTTGAMVKITVQDIMNWFHTNILHSKNWTVRIEG